MASNTARIIDLESYRKARQQAAAPQAPVPTQIGWAPAMYWPHMWMMVPVYVVPGTPR
jgi:hypothetical protein